MNEFIEKLITILDEEFECYPMVGISERIRQLAEEHKGGWIPCSERLPKDDSICIVTVEYPNNETEVDYGWFDRVGVCWYVGIQEFRTSNILAWQPLPDPYIEKK